jgi:hypothetical protein
VSSLFIEQFKETRKQTTKSIFFFNWESSLRNKTRRILHDWSSSSSIPSEIQIFHILTAQAQHINELPSYP